MRHRIIRVLFLLATSWLCFHVLRQSGYEAPWMPLQEIMRYSVPPPFGHRLLFAFLANGFQWVFPGFGYLKCFLLSQLVAIVLAFEAIRGWGALFIRQDLAFLAQLLLVAILIPTIGYFNFYDFGIVFFFTAGLLCLFKRRFAAYLVLLALGTLNHEGSLLLIPVFMAMHAHGNLARRAFWGKVAVQLVVWVGVRSILYWWLPATVVPALHLGDNARELLHPTAWLLMRYLPSGLWVGVAAFGIRYAPTLLKRCLILVPLLLITALDFGIIHEVRLFDALAPLVVALILCLISGAYLQRDASIS
jgi:hypothetical protein